jgi:hypothetical protein
LYVGSSRSRDFKPNVLVTYRKISIFNCNLQSILLVFSIKLLTGEMLVENNISLSLSLSIKKKTMFFSYYSRNFCRRFMRTWHNICLFVLFCVDDLYFMYKNTCGAVRKLNWGVIYEMVKLLFFCMLTMFHFQGHSNCKTAAIMDKILSKMFLFLFFLSRIIRNKQKAILNLSSTYTGQN